jgi:SEC-C motif
MKAGRNDPCPCGSGKKYKKCCLAKDQEESLRRTAVIPPPPSSVAPPRPVFLPTQQHPKPAGPTARARGAKAPTRPVPLDPVAARAESLWRDFESQNGEDRLALFLKTLEDAEVMTDDLAFEMLSILHTDAVKSGGRTRFAECVSALRERRPEVFDQSAPFYLSWCLHDALAEGRQEVVPSLARELAATAGRDIDTFNRAAEALAYHGQLHVLVEALRIAWPLVKSSKNVVPWGVTEFAEKGANHEIFDYLEHTASPDPADPVLLDRIQFFIEEPREDYLREFIGDLTGKSGREWQADDFALTPPRKGSRDDWGDDEEEEGQTPDQGAINLSRLISEFVGYLRREEGVPFPRGAQVRQELYRYFMRRYEGDLDPRPSMLEQALHPKRKLPKPPRAAHPLCPERVTLDVHLGGMMGMLNGLYHSAAALFQAMPAWLRFLESRRLIDADTSRKVATELLPLHNTLLQFWEQYTEDPVLYRQGQAWMALP